MQEDVSYETQNLNHNQFVMDFQQNNYAAENEQIPEHSVMVWNVLWCYVTLFFRNVATELERKYGKSKK